MIKGVEKLKSSRYFFIVPDFTYKICLQGLRAPWRLWAPGGCGNSPTTPSWAADRAGGQLALPQPWALSTSLGRGQDLYKKDVAWKVLGHLENQSCISVQPHLCCVLLRIQQILFLSIRNTFKNSVFSWTIFWTISIAGNCQKKKTSLRKIKK